ncbi:MAG: alpha/beta hydrolase [Tannerella sp.]|jgi:pimeloyl-ACP methyl ester carboxylesterase|nr:alpha/beta hydrolase [Tannerella sp.]
MVDNIKKNHFIPLLAACFIIFAPGCTDKGDGVTDPELPDTPENVSFEILAEYSFDDLKKMEKNVVGNSLSAFFNIVGNDVKYAGDVQIRAYKVVVETDYPAGSATKINLSGLLIAPPQEEGRKYRQVVAPPYTYVMKQDAPTLRVADGNLDSYLMFWLLEAYRHGFAVMIPDYPGFGDSYGRCYIPYVEKETMVRTTVEYVEAARSVLVKEKYDRKDGFVLSGYSLGAYVSLQLARAFETNASPEDVAVDLLVAGGAPCDLLHEANLIRASENTPQSHLFPLALLGYKKNSYPHLSMADYLKEPYASGAALYLDGQHNDFEDFFPNRTSDLFTEKFLKNEGMDEINGILEANSVKPWKNKCRFVMIHGTEDETVYYRQAKVFSEEQEKYGGSVSFVDVVGTHTSAGVLFFLRLYAELENL